MIKIAIADDEELFVQLLENFLNKQAHLKCVATALSGEDLLKRIDQSLDKPNVVILDLRMKNLDGAETVMMLKDRHPEVKSIVISSHYQKSFMGYMLRAGVNAFIPKGVSPEHLLKVIESVHHKGFYFMEEQVETMRSQIKPQAPKPKLKLEEEFTEREREVLTLLCQQFTAKEIAEKLFVSKRTVESHKDNLFAKTGARNLAGLVIYAIQNQLVNQADLPMFH